MEEADREYSDLQHDAAFGRAVRKLMADAADLIEEQTRTGSGTSSRRSNSSPN